MLVKDHIASLRRNLYQTLSKIKIYVERNLGFEAEHHHRALHDIPGVEFYTVRCHRKKYNHRVTALVKSIFANAKHVL